MAKSNVGKVYCGETKYIDPDTKKQRNYVIVRDNGKAIFVAKLKSIKKERFKLSSHDTYNAIVHARIQKRKGRGEEPRREGVNPPQVRVGQADINNHSG